MRLVDREQRDRHLLELSQEALVVEPLGSDVEELEAARAQARRDVAHLVRIEARVEPGRVDALADERVDLVLHQRDQRRGDDRDAVEQQRRQLIAKALSRACREDSERGTAGEQRLDDALLPVAKGPEPEPGGKQLARACLICFHMRQRSTAVGPQVEPPTPTRSYKSPNVPLTPSSSRRSWMESMILSILLTAVLTTVLVCPLLAASAIDRL